MNTSPRSIRVGWDHNGMHVLQGRPATLRSPVYVNLPAAGNRGATDLRASSFNGCLCGRGVAYQLNAESLGVQRKFCRT
jgi:hypothetical protein